MPKLKFIKNKQSIHVQAPSPGLESEYPANFFLGGKKPQLIIKNIYKELGPARDAFVNSLKVSVPDLDAGKEFTYRLLAGMKEDNLTEWKSYGITIAEAGAETNVWSLFDVTLKDQTPPATGTTGVRADADLAVLVIFCSVYRMGSIFDPNYLGAVSDRIMSQAVGIPNEVPKPDTLIALTGSWITDVNYLKMIAGIDMFLYRFPRAQFAAARIGTIASRCRDCASLLSIRFFLQMIGSNNIEEAPSWITYEPIAFLSPTL